MQRVPGKHPTFAATFLQQLLPDAERAQRCDDEDLEAPAAGGLTSYKSFAPGPRRFQLCVKRNPIGGLADFRLLDRSGPFGQSKGQWAVKNVATGCHTTPVGEDDTASVLGELFIGDIYHAFLDARLRVQLLVFLGAYVLVFCFFALVFLAVQEPCGLQLQSDFLRAYMLSVETVTTIGYGVSDPYLHGCWQGPIVLTSISLFQMLMGAGLIGVIFQRLSRPQSRARTIVFSDRAVIRCVDGAYYLMFRICDLRIRHALIEPRVRCYCAQMSEGRGFEMLPLRLQQPDDELGGSLLLALPSIVVHRLDAWSPLVPRPAARYGSAAGDETPRGGRTHPGGRAACLRLPRWPAAVQRQGSCEAGSRNSCTCPTCGEAFGTTELLQLHCRYLADADAASRLPPERCHRPLDEDDLCWLGHVDPSRREIKEHLERNYLEVVVLVEGTEPTTACNLQARHSYVVGGAGKVDVAWDADFAECCFMRTDGSRGLALDLGKFHVLERAPPGKEEG